MAFEVQDKVALVTGANRGIGKAITEALLSHGAAKVYAAVRKVESAAPLVEAHGDKVVPLELDLTQPATIHAAASSASDAELVINNAGVLRPANVLSESAAEALRFELEANLFGLLHVVHAFSPVLKANGGGALVQLNSVVSMKTFPEFTTYCASKAASYALTQSFKFLLKDQGTQVVSVHPGPIATDMSVAAGFPDGSPPEMVAEAILESLKNGEFHCFPDPMAQEIGGAYASFAKSVVEAEISES